MSDRVPTSIGRGHGRGRGGSRSRAQSEDVLSDASMGSAVMSESIIVQRQLTTLPGTLDVHMRQQVEVLTASQQLTYDQLKQFWDGHQALRRDTGAALGQAGEAFQKQQATQEALRVELEQQAQRVVQQQEQLQP